MKRFSLIVLLLVAGALQLRAQQGVLAGMVADSVTGQGLAYVHVQFSGEPGGNVVTVLTGEDGSFRLEGLTPGRYAYKTSCLGYYPLTGHFMLEPGQAGRLEIRMQPSLIPLGEIQVSSLRYNKLEKDVAMPISVVPRENFPKQSSVTLSDVLAREPGIALVRDGGWGTSVSIRGLGEGRLVTLVDGNRIETASDLVAGLSMFDVNEIHRVEIIKGAASSVYGTGAIGGVVNILTDKGHFYDKAVIRGSASGLFQTVNNMIGTHVGLESGSKSWKVRLSGGYRQAGDYRTPDGILANSGFTDRNLNATVGIRPWRNHELELNSQNYQALDVGIPGGAPFGKTALATYPEERRQLVSGRYVIRDLAPSLDEISLRIYHQYILRDVELLPNTPATVMGNTRITAEKFLPRGEHSTSGLVLETRWKTGDFGQLAGGVDLWQRKLVTLREKYLRQEILDAFQMPLDTLMVVRTEKPNPDSRFRSAGLFLQHESAFLNERLEVTVGLRADRISVANDRGLDPVGIRIDGVENDPVPNQRVVFEADTVGAWSWSANAGALYHLFRDVDLTLNAGRSYRSPSLEERFKYIDLGSKVRLGDPNLKPEKGWFGDLGFRIWKSRFQFQANGFLNYLNDLITEIPGEFIYTLNTGPNAGLNDTLPALINSNVSRALLTGFEASIHIQPFRNTVLFGKTAYVRGINLDQDASLPLIPPFNAGAGIRYNLPGVFTVEWTTTWHATQNRIAQGESATGSYLLSDFSLYSSPREFGITSFQLFTGVDNVFNKSYRNHLATNRGMIQAEPGRNVFVKLVMKF